MINPAKVDELKFINSSSVNWKVYGNEGDAYVQADAIIPQVVNNDGIQIEDIIDNGDLTRVIGRSIPGGVIRILLDGQVINQVIANNQGQFVIEGTRTGIFTLINSAGQSAKVLVNDESVVLQPPMITIIDYTDVINYSINGIADPLASIDLGSDTACVVVQSTCAIQVATADENGEFSSIGGVPLVLDNVYYLRSYQIVNGIAYTSEQTGFIPRDYID